MFKTLVWTFKNSVDILNLALYMAIFRESTYTRGSLFLQKLSRLSVCLYVCSCISVYLWSHLSGKIVFNINPFKELKLFMFYVIRTFSNIYLIRLMK